MINIKQYIFPGALSLSGGVWQAPDLPELSYPEEGRDVLFEIEDRSFWFIHRNRCIIEAIKQFSPTGPVFDIGGGNGFVTLGLEKAGFDTVLVEPGIGGVLNAQKRGGFFPIVCAAFDKTYFKPQSIPAVSLFDVIEHIPDDKAFLRGIYALVQNRAYLYITVPAHMNLWSTVDSESGHFRRYNIKKLQTLLEQCHFKTVYATYLFGYLPLPIYFGRVLPGKLGLSTKQKTNDTNKEFIAGKTAGLLLEKLSDFEANAIKRRKSLRFGASILIVAQKV